MKHSFTLLFSICLLVLHLSSQAQPTLTLANSVVPAGETQTFQLVEAELLNQGAAGANVTWNFSNLTLSGVSTQEVTVGASGTPYAAQFPNADIAIEAEGSYVYFDVTSSNYTLLGIASADITSIYSNPETVFVFPFTYGDNHEDDFYATGSLGGNTQYRFGTTTVTADGYGTLILPSGTYTNVLRIHAVQDSQR